MADFNAPLIALVLALSTETIEMLQGMHGGLTEGPDVTSDDLAAAKDVSRRLENLCMLRSLVQIQINETMQQAAEPSPVETITAYLQEHDHGVFPISIREEGKHIFLDTTLGVLIDTANWLDTTFPERVVVLNHVVRFNALEPIVSYPVGSGGSHSATRSPGFTPERVPVPPRPDNAPAPHNPQIHSGMPIDVPAQGMPGGRIGDKP